MEDKRLEPKLILTTILLLSALTLSNTVRAPDGGGVTVNPTVTADVPVTQVVPDANYGDDPELLVQSWVVGTAGMNLRVFVRFDLTAIPPGAKILASELSLYAFQKPSVSRTYGCFAPSASWDEMTITWNNKPIPYWFPAPTYPSAATGTAPDWMKWDVEEYVQRFVARDSINYRPNYGWFIRDLMEDSPSPYQTRFRSREYVDSNYRPKLMVQYEPPKLTLVTYGTSFLAGNWVKMTVQREDADGNPITRGVLNVDLASTSTSPNRKFAHTAGGATTSTITISDGAGSRDFWYYDELVGTWTITVSTDDYQYYGSDSDTQQVRAATPSILILTPECVTIASGGQYTSFTTKITDAFGNLAIAPSALAISLYTSSPSGEFRQPDSTTKITSVTIPASQSYAQFDYYDISGGTWTITVISSGMTPDTSSVEVIPDTNPPSTSLTVGTPNYTDATTTYVSGLTRLTLSASDTESGVKETRYRIDSGGWSLYSDPFTLAAYAHGAHTVGYLSTDKASNVETEKTTILFLDKTEPSVDLRDPRGTIWVNSLDITLNFEAAVSDIGSGLATVILILDGAEKGEMTLMALPAGGPTYGKVVPLAEGNHTWTARAADRVENSQQPTEQLITIRMDATPPTILAVSISPTSPLHGDMVTVSANVIDAESGVDQVLLWYSVSGATYDTVPMSHVSDSLYHATIPGQNVFSSVSYYVQAIDGMGNSLFNPTESYSVGIPMLWLATLGGAVVIVIIAVAVRRRGKPSTPQAAQETSASTK